MKAGKLLLLLIVVIALFFGAYSLLFLGAVGSVFYFSGLPNIERPAVQINPNPKRQNVISVTPIRQAREFLPESAVVEVVHTISHLPEQRSCVPASLETGTDYPRYPIKENPNARRLPDGSFEFIATHDYIAPENYFGKGKCRYRIASAELILSSIEGSYRVALTSRDVRDLFWQYNTSRVIFCLPGREFYKPSPQGLCRTSLDNDSAETVLKYIPMFIIGVKHKAG